VQSASLLDPGLRIREIQSYSRMLLGLHPLRVNVATVLFILFV